MQETAADTSFAGPSEETRALSPRIRDSQGSQGSSGDTIDHLSVAIRKMAENDIDYFIEKV